MFKSFVQRLRAMVIVALVGIVPLAGCVSNSAEMVTTQDGVFSFHDIRLQKGGLIHWAVLGVDNRTGQVIVNFGGETLTLGRQLIENLLSEGVLASVISGAAGIKISENGNCGGKGCSGNIFYVQAVSGSVSESGAESSSGAVAVSSKGRDLTKAELRVIERDVRQMLKQALKTAY